MLHGHGCTRAQGAHAGLDDQVVREVRRGCVLLRCQPRARRDASGPTTGVEMDSRDGLARAVPFYKLRYCPRIWRFSRSLRVYDEDTLEEFFSVVGPQKGKLFAISSRKFFLTFRWDRVSNFILPWTERLARNIITFRAERFRFPVALSQA